MDEFELLSKSVLELEGEATYLYKRLESDVAQMSTALNCEGSGIIEGSAAGVHYHRTESDQYVTPEPVSDLRTIPSIDINRNVSEVEKNLVILDHWNGAGSVVPVESRVDALLREIQNLKEQHEKHLAEVALNFELKSAESTRRAENAHKNEVEALQKEICLLRESQAAQQRENEKMKSNQKVESSALMESDEPSNNQQEPVNRSEKSKKLGSAGMCPNQGCPAHRDNELPDIIFYSDAQIFLKVVRLPYCKLSFQDWTFQPSRRIPRCLQEVDILLFVLNNRFIFCQVYIQTNF